MAWAGRHRARRIATVLAAAGAAVTALAPASAAGKPPAGRAQPPRALVAFVPAAADPAPGPPLLRDLAARPELAIGLTSPSLGPYARQQVLLDMSQGSRVSTRTYPRSALPPLSLRTTGTGGRIEGWPLVVRRARGGPGELVPGLLATMIQHGGGRVAYAGIERFPFQTEAVVAADRLGRIPIVSMGSERTAAQRALRLWDEAQLVVAQLPPGAAGLTALDRILVARAPTDLVYVLRAPPVELRLLPTGVAGPGYRGLLRSPTTRRKGVVTATDLAPTVLAHLALPVPAEMQGQVVEGGGDGDVDDLAELDARMGQITVRRLPALLAAVVAWLGLLGGLALARGREGTRTGLRLGFLALTWLPSLALLTAALSPSRLVEFAVLSLGSLLFAAATDRLMPWPAGPVVPAAALLLFHGIDLAAGSPLIVNSLTGPTPRGGARFFGVGNELETILIVAALIGAGTALARWPRLNGPWLFAGTSAIVAAAIGAGRLGADVGGVVTLAAGGAVAVVMSLPGPPGRRVLALAVLAPAFALAALVAIDVVTGGNAHFSRFVLEASGPDELIDIARRRLELAYSVLTSGTIPYSVGVVGAIVIAGIVRRRQLLAPLERLAPAAARGFRAGLWGTLAALVFGSVANDSGPKIFLIGSAGLIMAVAYVRGAPQATARDSGRPSSTIPRCA